MVGAVPHLLGPGLETGLAFVTYRAVLVGKFKFAWTITTLSSK